MLILYGYSNCTDKKYKQIVSEHNVAVLQPDQKYHGLLIKGLSKNDANVKCLSGLPINRSVTHRTLIYEKDETEKNVFFHYYTTINLPGIRQLMIFFAAFWNVLFVKKEKQTYAICDCLNIANAYGIKLGCKLRHIPVITIVTDLPDMMDSSNWLRKINNLFFNSVDGFILLTEQMNARVNYYNKPYIVLEGHSDSDAPIIDMKKKWEEETGKKIIIYAGSIQKLYGIQNLTEGFIQADLSNTELWIFGDGDYRETLLEYTKKYSSVKYKGIRNNEEVVAYEMKAALLVNPRPIKPEYTKFSFPSKNMEYMVSGTPLLTTKLPGMPKEYYPYIYLLEDESPDGIAKRLNEILNIPMKERNQKAKEARKFVIKEKSNVVQARKILDFLGEQVEKYV